MWLGPIGGWMIWAFGTFAWLGGTLSFKAYIAKFGLFWACEMGIGLS